MNLADLPATLIITNPGSVAVGIANIVVPAGQSVTVNLAAMGPARKCDIWLATKTAKQYGYVTTAVSMDLIADQWVSAHHYRAEPPLHMGTDGQESPLDANLHTITGGQGENYPWSGGGPVAPVISLDFSSADNSMYVAVISVI